VYAKSNHSFCDVNIIIEKIIALLKKIIKMSNKTFFSPKTDTDRRRR